MKDKKWLINIALVVVLFIGFRLIDGNRSAQDTLVDKTNFIMGTVVNLSMYDDIDEDIFEGAFNTIRNVENTMSLNIEDSELNKVNNNAYSKPVEISDQLSYVFKKSIEYAEISNGSFDITIGPISKLWSIGTDQAKVPKPQEIESVISKVNYKNIEIKDNQVKLSKDNMIIDLGGIAKGYAADQVVNYLKSKNIDRAIVDLGGNIYTLGSKDKDTPWTVGIQNPYNESRGDYLGLISVSDKSVVTSGVYERYVEKDNKKYHHILSPFTGYPIDNELMSVTIVSDLSIDGDALSTAAFALGLEKGTQLVESLDDVDAIFVTKDKEVYITPKLKSSFEIKNKDFTVK